jgi:hypothetical protein
MITPANYAFIIWGLIYVGLIAFGIHQLLPKQRYESDLNPVRDALIISSIAQIVWVFLFLFRYFWGSLIAMFAILIPLIWGYIQRRQTEAVLPRERWFVDRPLSLYLGWISVATIVNGAIALYSANWAGFGLGMPLWTSLMLGIATMIGGAIAIGYRDVVFPGVFVWAFVAIALRHSDNALIASTAYVGCALLAFAIAISPFQRTT